MDAQTTSQERRTRREISLQMLEKRRDAALRSLDLLRSAYSAELDQIKEDGSEAPDLIPFYGSIRKTLDMIGSVTDQIVGLSDHLKYGLLPQTFERDNIKNLTAQNGDRVHITTDVLASILKDNREEAYSWLRRNNHGDIIVEYIHPSTMMAFAKSWMNDTGQDFPPDSHIRVEFRPKANFTAGKDSPNKL